jgi:translation initiation factor 1 (eIF-1/SUI1)
MDEEMLAEVKELVAQVAKSTTGFGEVRIIVQKGRPRRVVTAVERWLEDRQASPGRPRSSQTA